MKETPSTLPPAEVSPQGPRPEAASPPPPPPPRGLGSGRNALFVAAGIFVSRIVGLVRESFFAYFLGDSPAAGAFKAALRVPNFLQNLLGEGVLSASFIPAYSRALGAKDDAQADEVAGAVFGLLSLLTAGLVALGVWATPALVDVIAPGFEGEVRALTIQLVRILFPGTGMLVLAAWCLGILNSHRRFFLSYAAPVVWNLSLMVALVAGGGRVSQETLAVWVAYGATAGGVLQFLIQVPVVLKVLGRFRPSLSLAAEGTRDVLRTFLPVVGSRGVVQISAYIDVAYASLISARAVAMLSYAQTLYLIPVSLFGMSVSAAELPEMARMQGESEEVARALRERVGRSLQRVAFFVIPSAAAFFFLGDVVGAALFQRGAFDAERSRYLWFLLMGASIGLLASTMGRVYASTFYALRDTRTPLRLAIVRVGTTAALGYFAALHLPALLGVPGELGTVGLTVSSGLAAWLEYALLRRSLSARIGRAGLASTRFAALWGSAAIAGVLGLGIKLLLGHLSGTATLPAVWAGAFSPPPALHPVLAGLLILVPYGVAYFGLTHLFGVPQASAVVSRVLRRR